MERDGTHRSPGTHAALSVLEALVAHAPSSLSELAAALALPKSSLFRVCGVLVERGWILRNADGRYELGIRAFGLTAQSSEYPIVRAFRSIAAELLTLHNETVCLAVLDGDESSFIAIEETSHPVRLVTHVGSRTPAFASASGRVILADRAEGVVASQFAGRPLITPTGRRLRDVNELLGILREVRRLGFAENREETAVGLHSISVPVTNASGSVLAALTMCVPTSRLTPARRTQLIAEMQEAGRRFSDSVAWLAAWNATRAEAREILNV
ncbi:MAG TPA: IclR family transcriptional regulator [Candidatus Dormibacteraeota bacterium]|nr:IclR family transcriptional regulator [Candidatus Dormibacteraeota bacterium]